LAGENHLLLDALHGGRVPLVAAAFDRLDITPEQIVIATNPGYTRRMETLEPAIGRDTGHPHTEDC
jgi:hypothetical protein